MLLGLEMVSINPLVHLRAAPGLGFLGFSFYAQGISLPSIYSYIGSAGVYLYTVFVTLAPVVIAAGAAVVGMGALASHFFAQ